MDFLLDQGWGSYFFRPWRVGGEFVFMPYWQTLLISVIKDCFHEKQLNFGIYKIWARGGGVEFVLHDQRGVGFFCMCEGRYVNNIWVGNNIFTKSPPPPLLMAAPILYASQISHTLYKHGHNMEHYVNVIIHNNHYLAYFFNYNNIMRN